MKCIAGLVFLVVVASISAIPVHRNGMVFYQPDYYNAHRAFVMQYASQPIKAYRRNGPAAGVTAYVSGKKVAAGTYLKRKNSLSSWRNRLIKFKFNRSGTRRGWRRPSCPRHSGWRGSIGGWSLPSGRQERRRGGGRADICCEPTSCGWRARGTGGRIRSQQKQEDANSTRRRGWRRWRGRRLTSSHEKPRSRRRDLFPRDFWQHERRSHRNRKQLQHRKR